MYDSYHGHEKASALSFCAQKLQSPELIALSELCSDDECHSSGKMHIYCKVENDSNFSALYVNMIGPLP